MGGKILKDLKQRYMERSKLYNLQKNPFVLAKNISSLRKNEGNNNYVKEKNESYNLIEISVRDLQPTLLHAIICNWKAMNIF